jgi:hypothetical protein
VLNGKVIFPVVRQALVKGTVLLRSDVGRVASPDGLGLVEFFVGDLLLLDFLRLLLFLLFVFIDFFDLGLLAIIFLRFLLLVVFDLLQCVVRHTQDRIAERAYLLNFLCHSQLNGIRDELGVLLDDLLDLFLLEVLELIFFEVETDFTTTTERRIDGVGCNSESATGRRLPNVLLIVVVLRDELDALGNKVGGVETNTELTNHGDISTGAQSLHESLTDALESKKGNVKNT